MGDAILLVGNPSSRGGKAAKRIERARVLMSLHGLNHVFKPTLPHRGTVGMVAESIAEEGFRTLVYLGGDGTFYEVACGICQSGLASEVRLGLLPSGTANDQGKSFGISSQPKDLEANIRTISAGHTTKLDVGEVTAYSDSGLALRRDLFFDSMDWGLSASILQQRNRDVELTKDVPVIKHMYRDHVVYVRVALQEAAIRLVSRDRFSAEVTVDGEAHAFHNLTDLVIKNTLIMAGDWIIDPMSRPDDGKMEVAPFYGIGDWTQRVILNHKRFPLKGNARNRMGLPPLEIFKGAEIRVQLLRPHRDESLPVQIDGEEFLSANTFDIKVHPQMLTLLVPEAATAI